MIVTPAGIPVDGFAMEIEGPGGFELPGTSISLDEAEPGQPYTIRVSYTGREALQLVSAACNVQHGSHTEADPPFVVVPPLEPGVGAHCEFHYGALERPAVPAPPGAGSGWRTPHGRDASGAAAIAVIAATALVLAAARRNRRGHPPRGGSE